MEKVNGQGRAFRASGLEVEQIGQFKAHDFGTELNSFFKGRGRQNGVAHANVARYKTRDTYGGGEMSKV